MEAFEYLEKEWGAFNGWPYMVGCASGTAALHLALECLQLKPGSQIIIPDYTMIACARAVTLAGLTPVFVDCDENGLINPAYTELVPGMPAAIMPVHIYGRRCNMDMIADLADRRGMAIIEDMSEIHGIKPHPKTTAACWSFYKNKIVHGEEGGTVAFNCINMARTACQLRTLGFTPDHNFLHVPRGHNYRLSNTHAQLVRNSLKNYKDNCDDRRQIEDWYDSLIPQQWKRPPRDAVWVYDVQIRGMTSYQQSGIVHQLNELGIPARCSFKPMSKQPEYYQHNGQTMGSVLAREVLYLPVRPDLNKRDVQRNVERLVEAAKNVGIQ